MSVGLMSTKHWRMSTEAIPRYLVFCLTNFTWGGHTCVHLSQQLCAAAGAVRDLSPVGSPSFFFHSVKDGYAWWEGTGRLNTDLMIWSKIRTDLSVAVILLRTEHTCSVKSRAIQSNLSLIQTMIVAVKDDKKVAMINLEQSKAFDKFDHQFRADWFKRIF